MIPTMQQLLNTWRSVGEERISLTKRYLARAFSSTNVDRNRGHRAQQELESPPALHSEAHP